MFHKQGQKPTEHFSEAILELLVEGGGTDLAFSTKLKI